MYGIILVFFLFLSFILPVSGLGAGSEVQVGGDLHLTAPGSGVIFQDASSLISAPTRASLGAAASGANSDITSLSGLSTPLSTAQGGTGSNSKNFVSLTGDQMTGGLRVTQTGTSMGAGAFVLDNLSNSNPAIYGFTSGLTPVLLLQNAGTDAAGASGGDFIKAVNSPGSDTQFVVTTDGKILADSILKVGTNISSGDTQGFNSFGSSTKREPSVFSPNDLFVSGALEVGGTIFGESFLYLRNVNTSNSFRLFAGVDGDIEFHRDMIGSTNSWFRVWTDGGTIEQLRIQDGNEAGALFDGTVTSNGLDYAEAFSINDRTLEAGDVVVLDLGHPGYIKRSTRPYAMNLLGVISEQPAFVSGKSFAAEAQSDPQIAVLRKEARQKGHHELEKSYTMQLQQTAHEQSRPVALAGRVPVKVDGAHGQIHAGDRLTSSPTAGHAMAMKSAGQTIGIALEPWEGDGRGKILVLIQPGWCDPQQLGEMD